MKKILNLIVFTLYGISAHAQNKADTYNLVQLPGGVAYRILYDKPGGTTPNKGDYIEAHMYVNVDGQEIYNSRQINDGKTVSFVMQPTGHKTDIQEVIKLMTPGDSAIIVFSVDSLLKTGVEKLKWMKPNTGQKAKYFVKMIAIKPFGAKKEESATPSKK